MPWATGNGQKHQNFFRVLLTAQGDDRIRTIKVIRAVSNMGLKEAKFLSDEQRNLGEAVMYWANNAEGVNETYVRLVQAADEAGASCRFETRMPEGYGEFERPDDPTIQLAIYLAREFPIKPEEIRKISDILNETPDPVTALRQAANMIETA